MLTFSHSARTHSVLWVVTFSTYLSNRLSHIRNGYTRVSLNFIGHSADIVVLYILAGKAVQGFLLESPNVFFTKILREYNHICVLWTPFCDPELSLKRCLTHITGLWYTPWLELYPAKFCSKMKSAFCKDIDASPFVSLNVVTVQEILFIDFGINLIRCY